MVVRVELVGRMSLTAGDHRMNAARLGRHDRLVLAYLTLERSRHVSRDELAELVWEERVPPSWKTALRGVVSRVRSALATTGLPPGSLATGPGWYGFSLPPETVVDVELADTALTAAIGLLADGRAEDARTAAESTLTIARQPFLPGVHAAWVDQRQELLDELRLRALKVIADASLRSGAWPAAQRAAEQALGLAPLRESFYRRLALAHAGSGDRGEALRVLTRCRTALAEEFGADIAPETEALSVGLLQGNPVSTLLPGRANAARRREVATAPEPGGTNADLLARLTDTSTPFVNRVAELAQLRACWHRAIDGAPETVVVVGEAGAGKSRLIAEFARAATQQGATVLCGQSAAPFGLGPLVDAVRGHLPGGVLAGSEPVAIAEAVRTALGRITSTAPAVLILDDLQWLDRDTATLLRYVLRSPDRLPLLVVGGYRTGGPAAARELEPLLLMVRRERPATRIDLAGLRSADVADLVRACTGQSPDTATAAAIADATAGNPLFVRELMRLVGEEGRASVVNGVLTLDGGGALKVPDGVRQVILARCDQLTAAARRVLAVAAVCGRETDLATLEAIAELSTTDVLAAVEQVVASHLMVERPVPAGRFAFVHGLVQETLYRELSAARRQRLHIEVADALQAHPGTAASPPQLAYHLIRGGPEVAEQATIAAARAGADALRRHSYDEAARHYTAALDVAGTDPSVRCRLRLDLAGSRWRAGDTTLAQEEFEVAATEAYQAARPDLAARAVFGGAGHGPTIGRSDERAVGRLGDALSALDPLDPFRPRLLARLGAELAGAADPRADDLCREALALASEGDDTSTVAYALNCRSWVSLAAPSDRSGLAWADRMLELASVVGDRHMQLEGRLWRCTFLLRSGRLEEAERETVTLEELAIQLRQPFYLRLPLRLRACLTLLEGRYDEAAGLAAEAYVIERRVHPADAEVHALLHSAALGYASGRWPELDSPLFEATVSEPGNPHWTAIRAAHLAAHGRVDAAARLLRPLLSGGAPTLRHGPLAPFAAALVARACAVDGRLRARVDADVVAEVLESWRGTHIVAGCAVASLGLADRALS